MSQRVRIALVGASLPGALLFGTVAVLIVDSDHWAFRHGWVFWLGLFVAAGVITYFGLALVQKRSGSAHAVAGATLVALLSVSFVLGTFLPYAANLGDRTVDDFGDYSEMSWENQVQGLLFAALIVGAMLGALVGFTRGVVDRSGRNQTDRV